jgi:uncharacterized protein (TIRG00374 family)
VKARLITISAGLVVILALAVALAPMDLRQASNYMAGHPSEVVLALVAYTGAFVLRTASWRPLIGARVPLGRLFTLLMGALFLNHAAPAKAGDLARAYALARRVPAERAVVSVVLGRVVDLAGLLTVLVVAWAWAGAGNWDGISLPAIAVVGAALALFMLVRLEPPFLVAGRFGGVGRSLTRARAALRGTTRTAFLGAFSRRASCSSWDEGSD